MAAFCKFSCFKTLFRHTLQRNVRHGSSKIVQELYDRKMIEAVFPAEHTEWLQILASGSHCAYAGCDPTSESLHLGNLAILMALMHWQRAGHQAIALIGGATAQIGDPSGKNHERDFIQQEAVNANVDAIQASMQRIFQNHEEYFWKKQNLKRQLSDIIILNNASWYEDKGVIPFMVGVGQQFRISKMLSRTSVKNRISSGEGMNFTEFSYLIFQSYDWLYLFDKYSCRFQIGGGDQMGNIEAGHDLVKKVRRKDVYGLMVPLIKATSGDKYGKTAGNAIWLDSSKTSPFEFYQFFMTLLDKEVPLYLRYFTFDSMENINSLITKHTEHPDKRQAQKKLAEDVTLLVHGEEGLKSAKHCTNALFHSTPESLGLLSETELNQIFQQCVSVEMLFEPGITMLDMAMYAKVFLTLESAIRTITEGGFYVNSIKVTNHKYVLVPEEHILPNGITVIRLGKKTYFLVKWQNV